MKLIICEKPKVAEKIAQALSSGNPVRKNLYGVSYYEVERGGELLVVVSAVGHLYTLRQTGTHGRVYPVFDIEWAPTYEVEKGADYSKKYLDAIRKLAPDADEYICACDFDVEGSLIGYNVIKYACNSDKGLRMKFSALTKGDLENAYEERFDLDVGNAYAGEARHILDWYYGINLSRALMASIRSAGANQVISTGRVQGPALAILAKREKEIRAFVPTPYWELTCAAKDAPFQHKKGRFLKREEAEQALANSKSPGTITKIEKREYLQEPPFPFDLTSLQVEAYRTFSFAPALTLELAQSLYEASLISYPRTSSQKLPEKLNLKKIIESLSKNANYEKHAKLLLAGNRTKPNEGKKEDPAHPAIHPTGQMGQSSEKAMKLYDLIVKRFLSCFAESAKRESQKVELAAGAEPYGASGNRTVYQGWFEIYAPYVKLEEVTLPPFSEGETVEAKNFMIHDKKTQPPKRYTPASIISELEKKGLGTKATRATVIETLFKRGYLEGKSIQTTPFGMAVFDVLSKFAPEILDEDLTKNIEEEMERIQDGENKKKAVEEGKKVLMAILKGFDGREREVGLGLLSGLKKKEMGESLLGKCPTCKKGDMRVIRSKAGKLFTGCSNYPECRTTFPLPQAAKNIPTGKTCEKCQTPIIRVQRRGKKPFEMCLDPNCETKKNWGKPRQVFSSAITGAAKPSGALVKKAPDAPAPEAKKPIAMKKEEDAPKEPAKEAATEKKEEKKTEKRKPAKKAVKRIRKPKKKEGE